MSTGPRRYSYPTDTTEEEWASAAPYLTLLPADAGQRRHDLRAVYDATRWLVRAGAAWRRLPGDFPPWHAVYDQARRWLAAGCFEAMAHDLRAVLRLAEGRAAEPSAAILDSRTLRSTPESGARAGWDGAKRQKGSKPHAAVDTLGHLLALHVTPADAQDRAQVGQLAAAVQEAAGEGVELAHVDQGYTGERPAEAAAEANGIALHVVRTPEAKRGFVLLPRRWVVEVVFTQMAKADVLALRAGGQDVTDLDLGIGDDHPVDQEQHELAALLEAGLGQTALHTPAECLQRCRQAGKLPLALGVVA
jgi:transposase